MRSGVLRSFRSAGRSRNLGCVLQLKAPEFDTSALITKLDIRAAGEFENVAGVKFSRRPTPVVRTAGSAILDTILFFLWILLCVATMVWPFTFETDNRVFDEPVEKFALGLILVLPVTVVYFPVGALVIWLVQRGEAETFPRHRLSQFATMNGMTYLPKMKLSDGSEAFDVITGGDAVRIEIGNLHLPIPATKSGATAFAYGYAAVQLPSLLPHIVLDAVRNDVVFSLSAGLDRDQHLSLEGDFDRYFRLFCAEDYERDALYLFTPDVMDSFINGADTLEAEFRNDVLFLYSARELSTTDPEDWALVSRAIGAILPQFTAWERWRDSGPDGSMAPLPAHLEPLSVSVEPTAVETNMGEEKADETSNDLLIARRTDDLVTTPMKRRAPLWVRFLQVSVIGYGLALFSLIFIMD